jgi:PAS domain S-box-containing protein
MTGGNARQTGHGQGGGRATGPPLNYAAYLDPARLPGRQHALAFLSGILTAPSGSALFATDESGTVLAWSRTAAALFGRPPRAVLGLMSLADLLPAAGKGGQRDGPLASALRSGAWDGLLDCLTADGKRRACRVELSRLPGGTGGTPGVLAVVREITRELHDLASLQAASGEALSLFMENPLPLIGTSPLGVITHANRAAGELLGRSPQSLAGTRISTLFTRPEEGRSAIARALRDGAVSGAVLEAARPDGGARVVSFSAVAYPGPDGRLAGLVTGMTDFTDRNRELESLRRSAAYYRSLIEAAGAVVVVDPAGNITDANGRAAALLGYQGQELTGLPLADRFASPRQVTGVIGQTLAGGSPAGAEYELVPGNGTARRVWLSASALGGPGGAQPRAILSMHDVTAQARLRDRLSEERAYNRTIIEASAHGLAMIDLQDRVSDVNEALCELTGRTRPELVGAPFAGLFTDPGAAAGAVHQALASGGAVRCELQLATAGQRQVAVSASPVRDRAGEVAGVLASARDVSEQARLQRALAAEQAYHRAVIDSVAPGLFAVTAEGRITDVNPAGCRLTGRTRQQLTTQPFTALFTSQEAAQQALAGAFAEGRLTPREFVLATRHPQHVAVTVAGGVFTDPRGDGVVLLAVMDDITARRRAGERLRDYSESLYQAIADGLITTDALGVIADVNHPMEELAGREAGEMTGHHLDEYFTEPARARELLSLVLRQGRVTDYELAVRRPDGSARVVSCSAASYTGGDGKLTGMLVIARDVSGRRQSAELQARLLEQARELDQAKTGFVSRVSHELRSPLTNVLGYLELIRTGEAGPLTGEQRQMLDVVNRNARRLLTLIEDLLLLARIEGGAAPLAREPVRIDALVRGVTDSFAAAFRQGQLTSSADIEPGLQIEGDPRQLTRVVTSLLSNAVKFTPPGGRVGVSCRRQKDEVVIEVDDTGPGVPEDEQPRLFTRFFRSAMAAEQET